MPFVPAQFPPARHRVVVTGLGMITSMGNGWRANADGFREGRAAFRPVTLFDTARQRVHEAGEITLPAALPRHSLSQRDAARLDRASALLLHAAREAWDAAGWDEAVAANPIPLCLGTSAGAMAEGEAFYRLATASPPQRRGQAEKVRLYQTHRQAAHLLDALDFTGPVSIVANACASGANAIGQAFRLLQEGPCARALCGGYDALCQLVFAGFDSLQALTTTLPPRPFDARRDGLALGEGAAMMTLETLEAARARGAPILAEIAGYGIATDRHHLTQPHPEGDAALASMSAATREAGLAPEQIGYINSHGTGTPLNDVAEARAISRWAGSSVADVAVSSTKASIGHLLGGAGAVEAGICLMALREGFLPPTTTVETLDAACAFDFVSEPREKELRHVLTNSFGFGGANATLIFSALR